MSDILVKNKFNFWLFMNLIARTKQAFFKALGREDNMLRLSEKTGIAYPIINKLNSGKSAFENIPLGTFERLFPELEVTFFKDERKAKDNTVTAKDIYGGVQQGSDIEGGLHIDASGNQPETPPEHLKSKIYAEVMEKLMDSEEIDDSIKVKIFKILKSHK